ncbi:MAG: hypothetical protein ABIO70_04430 [Pseudomonadota bacterium]
MSKQRRATHDQRQQTPNQALASAPEDDMQSLYGNQFLAQGLEGEAEGAGAELFARPATVPASAGFRPPSARPEGAGEPGLLDQAGEMIEDVWEWIFGEGEAAQDSSAGQGEAEQVPAPTVPADWWATYAAESDWARRRRMVYQACENGSVNAIIAILPQDVRGLDTATFEEQLDEVLDFVQQHAMVQASGHDMEEMGQIQGAYMHEQARQEAVEQHGEGATPEQIEDARQETVAEQDYLSPTEDTEWSRLRPDQQAARTQRGEAVLRALVAEATSRAPELGLRADQLVLDYQRCEELGALAYSQGGQCHLSWLAVQAAEADPAFMLSTVVHELAGHPEFDRGHSVSGFLFQLSTPHIPGYQAPAEGSPEAEAENRRFYYFESEIGSLLREYGYWVQQNEQGVDNPQGSPLQLLDIVLEQLRGQWAPELERPWYQGLSARFQADPRVTDEAHRVFLERLQAVLGISL